MDDIEFASQEGAYVLLFYSFKTVITDYSALIFGIVCVAVILGMAHFASLCYLCVLASYVSQISTTQQLLLQYTTCYK